MFSFFYGKYISRKFSWKPLCLKLLYWILNMIYNTDEIHLLVKKRIMMDNFHYENLLFMIELHPRRMKQMMNKFC
jgi:hypothetical protein